MEGRKGKRRGRRGRREKEGGVAATGWGGEAKGRERDGRGDEEKRKRGWAKSWNRAAEWLRPALSSSSSSSRQHPSVHGV